MRTDIAPKPTRLEAYTPSNFSIDSVNLDFDLDPHSTHVRSTLDMRREGPGSLTLDGEDIELVSVKVDGKLLRRSEYRLTQKHLILETVPDQFVLEIETRFNPSENTKLMGLYVSSGRFCTQCEAEGFRRMTYYLDRPDVMSVFTVRMSANKADYIELLSNGNRIEYGEIGTHKHYAVWHDPYPKPCYLFALVAGMFDVIEDTFTTMSGRKVDLAIYVDPGDASKAEYAMDALKRSMDWDERAFGREYDLDRFMIVAVRDFNFGAMENKGLNIFNSSLLLADPATATDMNYERIESVVAHEYFHNWTGNRITCRDWFQLCLKEGFTVFRDQEFSASQRGQTIQRIKDVRALRSRQFTEDGGPLAHPVRPSEYIKIDNFYTSTVYEKGAELIRMLKIILGADMFRRGCDHYFASLDGTASTVEEFLACFEHVSGEDLSQFMLWYQQAGTPTLSVRIQSDGPDPNMTLRQTLPATPGQTGKSAQIIPVRWQCVFDDGSVSAPMISVLKDMEARISLLPALKTSPAAGLPYTVSLLQDFSAPVHLDTDYSPEDLARLMRYDANGFNRWEAGQTLARRLLSMMALHIETGKMPAPDPLLKAYITGLRETLDSPDFDPAFKALMLTHPTDQEITQSLLKSDPIAVNLAGEWLRRAVSDALADRLIETYHALGDDGPFEPDAASAGRRALRNRCLGLLADRFDPQAASLAIEQFHQSENMTNEIAALITLIKLGGRRVEDCLKIFYDKWSHNPLVIDKWFAVAASRGSVHPRALFETLVSHPAYTLHNPNRVRALIGGFAMNNPKGFHHPSGEGYAIVAEQILEQDAINPQVAARLLGVFEIWRKLDDTRQSQIQTQLDNIIAQNPSENVLEIATKTRG